MTRSSFKRLWLIGLLLVVVASAFVYRQAGQTERKIGFANIRKDALYEKLDSGSQVSADLAKLDSITINERDSTKLNVLRNLGLENTDLSFEVQNKLATSIGRIRLYSRRFVYSGSLPYADAYEVIDQLHHTKKVIIDEVTIKPTRSQNKYGDVIDFRVGGVIYGLEKNK